MLRFCFDDGVLRERQDGPFAGLWTGGQPPIASLGLFWSAAFWSFGSGNILALQQYNWLTHEAPFAAQATVVLRGYKQGEYLAPYMSSLEAEYRRSLGTRWGASAFVGIAGLYGDQGEESSDRRTLPAAGVGLQFILKPVQRMLASLEYAQGAEGNRGVHLKFGYAW